MSALVANPEFCIMAATHFILTRRKTPTLMQER
jgi:hypothetical protein